ncbi:MAG TPA: hypothetical protein VIT67_18750, partial [Povalibacter sp.]
NVSLQASSDQSWLHVSVPDGQSVVLTADPGSPATDQFYTATVTLSSTDPLIVNQEVIRVGLWRGSADPADLTIATSAFFLAAHPVEPVVFANDFLGSIHVYNVYTGALVRTLAVGSVGPIALSTDGSTLYVGDYTTKKLVALDPLTGAVLRSYQTSMDLLSNADLTLAYARPDGHPILLSGRTSEAFDEQSSTKLDANISGAGQVVASKDGRRIYVQTAGLSPTPMSMTEVRYSTLNSVGLAAVRSTEWSGHFDDIYMPGNGLDIALTEDDAHLYRANGAPYGFGVVDPLTLVASKFLPAAAYPAAVQCGWRGYCFGSAGPDWDTDQDVWIYDANQQYVDGFVLGAQNLNQRGLVLSADNTRLIAGLTVQPNDSRRLKILNTPQ